ncbi:MAG: M20/M25/M40 family metallo-hydrolase [Myxococcota bacterium]
MSRAPRALFDAALVLCLMGGAACGTGQSRLVVGERPSPLVVDADLFDAVVPFTRALVRTGTAGAGASALALALVAERLQRGGVSVDIDYAADGTPLALLAEVTGHASAPDSPGLLLFAHTTPFPIDGVGWRKGTAPFDAAILGEHLVGRGVLDMHGPLAVMALALEVVTREPTPPAHPVRLLVVANDEDGAAVARALQRWPRLALSSWVLGQGGFIVEDHLRAGEDAALVSYATKGSLVVELSTAGVTTAVEYPERPSAPVRLAAALTRATTLWPPQRLPDVVLPMVQGLLAARRSPLEGFATTGLLRATGRDVLLAAPPGEAILTDTCAVRELRADGGARVPGSATALLDCRFLPGQSAADFRDQLLLRIDDPRVEVRVLGSTPASSTPAGDPKLQRLLKRLRDDTPARVVLPVVSAEPSGLAWFRARGARAVGFFPLRLDRDELNSRHAPDERVRVRELESSLQPFLGLLEAMLAMSSSDSAR